MKKNVIIGIAAGAAALAATTIILKKLNLLDKLLHKADGLTGKLSDFCDTIPKGEEKNVSKKFK